MSLNDPWARPSEPDPEHIPALPPEPTQYQTGLNPTVAQPTHGLQPGPYGAAPPGYPPPYQGPPGYPYQPGYPYPPPRATNGLAIAGMVCSIIGVVFCWFWFLGLLMAVLGTAFSHVSLAAVRRSGENGEGFAIAGIAVGWVGIGLGLVSVIGWAQGPGVWWWT